MEITPKKSYVGKYVCYNQNDGGACWGRIKEEAVVNTMSGEKEVFILTDRYVRHLTGDDRKRFKFFYPDATNEPLMRRPLDGKISYQVSKVKGDTTIRKELLDLEKDVIDIGDLLKIVDTDTLFRIVMGSWDKGALSGNDAFEIGILASEEVYSKVKEVLKERVDNA
jgi:hypothetical protein